MSAVWPHGLMAAHDGLCIIGCRISSAAAAE